MFLLGVAELMATGTGQIQYYWSGQVLSLISIQFENVYIDPTLDTINFHIFSCQKHNPLLHEFP